MENQFDNTDLIQLYENAFRENWDCPMFSDYEGESYSYSEVAEHIGHLHLFFKSFSLKRGDKIAFIGKNSSLWAISFLAAITYGAVAVPILPDFHIKDINHIINHSDSRILFSTEHFFNELDINQTPNIKAVISLDSKKLLFSKEDSTVDLFNHSVSTPLNQSADKYTLPVLPIDDPCIISYTSGTTGFTKGVILSVKNIFSNIVYGREKIPLEKESNILSFLPLAHVFGLMFDFLYPITFGCHITFLSKIPSPKIIVEAFKKVKPILILSVPLVIEKIYFKQIYPKLNKPFVKLLMHIPGFSSLVKKNIRKKLIKLFGGNCKQVILGGAAFNKEVESFFISIKFPLTVGYGMTECGPLIGYSHWGKRKKSSSGQLVDRMKIKIDSSDPYNKVGEIQVKGDNIMLGYYKNPKSTNEAFDKEGWLHTGDLGLIDNEQNIFIKGRSKDMILDSSGQNIYPEVIENSLSQMPFVTECVVVQRDKKLIALVYSESFAKKEISKEETDKKMEKNRNLLNHDLPKYSQIKKIEIMDKEFEKTPKRNIRRFLYT